MQLNWSIISSVIQWYKERQTPSHFHNNRDEDTSCEIDFRNDIEVIVNVKLMYNSNQSNHRQSYYVSALCVHLLPVCNQSFWLIGSLVARGPALYIEAQIFLIRTADSQNNGMVSYIKNKFILSLNKFSKYWVVIKYKTILCYL